jgi:hypothetical protein
MQKLHKTILINAPREKVWEAMLDPETYKEWTSAFNSGSRYEGDWNQGSTIRFIGPDPETGKEGGMISRIAQNRPNEFISIEHLGIIKNGVEDTTSEEARKWVPAFENYTFIDMNGATELHIDQDIAPEYKNQFEKMWDEALQKLKGIAEHK